MLHLAAPISKLSSPPKSGAPHLSQDISQQNKEGLFPTLRQTSPRKVHVSPKTIQEPHDIDLLESLKSKIDSKWKVLKKKLQQIDQWKQGSVSTEDFKASCTFCQLSLTDKEMDLLLDLTKSDPIMTNYEFISEALGINHGLTHADLAKVSWDGGLFGLEVFNGRIV